MKIDVYPEIIREFMPITIRISEVRLPLNASIRISPKSKTIEHLSPFTLPLTEKDDHWEASLWLQKEGIYEMSIPSAEGTTTQNLTIHPQVFLDFTSEFGLFGISFAVASSLLIFWFLKRRRTHVA